MLPLSAVCTVLWFRVAVLASDAAGTETTMPVTASTNAPGADPGQCSLCPGGGDVSNDQGVIPLLQIPGKPSSTCQVASSYAKFLAADSDECALLQREAAFCGCPGVSAPTVDFCSLCNDGADPPSSNLVTGSGVDVTCQALNDYLKFLTKDDCDNTERGQALRRHAFGCGCLDAPTECAMCPDGTIDLSGPEKVVPLFTVVEGLGNPTCEQLSLIAAASPPDGVVCSVVEAQAGFCGCAGVGPLDECSFCPEGGSPTKPGFVTSAGATCKDLDEYISFVDEEGCDAERIEDMRAFAYVCGCPGVEASCTLCPDGSDVPSADLEVESDIANTCGEIAQVVTGLTKDRCDDQRDSLVGIAAARCGCPGVTGPVCSVQQNPSNCTFELLETVADEDCECYSFCDDAFVQCSSYPGALLAPQTCPGRPVAGCNVALATLNKDIASQEEDSAKRSRPSAFASLIVSLCAVSIFLIVAN